MILFYARKRYAACSSDDRLTTGSVGVEVVFHFSDDWTAAPARIAVFRGSGVSVDVALLEDSCTVPPEVLTQPGSTLAIGVYGTDGAGTVVIPTVYAEAGQIRRGAEPSGIDPTPQTQPLIDQFLAAAQAARDAADEAERLAQSVKDAADAGEFNGQNGAPGNSLWWTVSLIDDESMAGQVYGKILSSRLKGRSGVPAVHDLVVGPAVGTSGNIGWLYEIIAVSGIYCNLHGIGSIKGAPGNPGAGGYAPEVTFEQIDGGHRITITSAAHPEGQSFDVMDGTGGGVTVDDALSGSSTNPVQNKVVKAALDGKGTYSKPASGIPKTDMAEDVQTSLGKADTALQNVKIPKGELNGTSTSTVMTATIDGVTALYDGLPIWLKNGVETSAAGVTLNINNLGAKPIYASQSAATAITTQFNVNYTALLIYNSTRVTGGCWDYVYGYETNTTYTPVKLGFGYTTCSTAEATAAKTAALSSYTLTTGGIVAVKFTNAVGNGATLNINSKGAKAIYYKGAAITAGVIKAGDTVTMIYSTYYHVLSIDRDVDTLPPTPSNNIPQSINTLGSAGSSLEYARADHVHDIDGNTMEIVLDEYVLSHIDLLILPSGAADGNTVVLRASMDGHLFLNYEIMSARKHIAYFVIPLVAEPVAITDFQVVSDASVSKVYATANGLGLQYNGIADGKLYSAEFVLPFDSRQGTGTLSVTDLALPSAQGVSF